METTARRYPLHESRKVFDLVADRRGDDNLALLAVFQGGIRLQHGIAPHVVDELVPSHNTGHHRARADTDRQLQVLVVLGIEASHDALHLAGEIHRPSGVVQQRCTQPAGCHVGVTDGLDFLDAEASRFIVETGHQFVEHGDRNIRRYCVTVLGEAAEPGEQNADIRHVIGNFLLTAAQAACDTLR